MNWKWKAVPTAWWPSCGPGNVHSAEGWEEVLLPEIERQQRMGKEVAFRADAALPSRISTRRWKRRA